MSEYYAVPDPTDPDRMVYLRRNARGGLDPWPAKARYGPVLLRREVPAGLRGKARTDWVRKWFADHNRPWWDAVRQNIDADPLLAQARWSAFNGYRCCFCGRALTDDASKVYAAGPECRQGLPDAVLADLVHRVGIAHAEVLAAAGGAA